MFNDKEATQSTLSSPAQQTENSSPVMVELDQQSILWNELMSKKLPKVYSLQRLLLLQDTGDSVPLIKYIDEWMENNPKLLFQRVFEDGNAEVKAALKGKVIQRTVAVYPGKAEKIIATLSSSEDENFIQGHLAAGYFNSYPVVLTEMIRHTGAFNNIPGPAADIFVNEIYQIDQIKAAEWLAQAEQFSTVEKYQVENR